MKNEWRRVKFQIEHFGKKPKTKKGAVASWQQLSHEFKMFVFFSHFFSSSNFSLKILFIVKLFSKEKCCRSSVTFRRNEHIKKGQSYKIKTEISRGLSILPASFEKKHNEIQIRYYSVRQFEFYISELIFRERLDGYTK